MSIAFTYEILGSDERTPVLIVVMVSTVVMPERKNIQIIFLPWTRFIALLGFSQSVLFLYLVSVRMFQFSKWCWSEEGESKRKIVFC